MIAGSLQAKAKPLKPLGIFSLFLLAIGYLKRFKVEGDSMIPMLRQNDYVFYKPINNNLDLDINEGEIVIAKHPIKNNTFIIKMVYMIKDELIDIRGLNESISIDSRQFGLISTNNIVGVVSNILSSTKYTNYN